MRTAGISSAVKRFWFLTAVIGCVLLARHFMAGSARQDGAEAREAARRAAPAAKSGEETSAPTADGVAQTGAAAASPSFAPSVNSADPAAPVAATNAAVESPPATAVEHVRGIVTQFNSMFGENPVGTNPEITKALRGANPKQIDFLTADSKRVNAQGELVDPWGTPYFFHQLSARQMEVRSAGPDRMMWTADDLVAR